MIVAAHQPHFLPWLGYLDKVRRADCFVVMDDLQYEAQNFQNRQRVKVAIGARWLTVPLAHASQTATIRDREIDNSAYGRHSWQHKHWRTLELHYSRAPFFDRYAADLEEVFHRRWRFLIDLDLRLLELARSWLGITTPVILASSLGATGAKTERILAVCRKLGATKYLAGTGASLDYLDVKLLERCGIDVEWHRYDHPTYVQRYPEHGFLPRLGFLDYVLNTGGERAGIDIAGGSHAAA